MTSSLSFLCLYLSIFICAAQECVDIPGAWCGDPVFDDCDGSWDYGMDCDPFYFECCVPDDPPATTTTSSTTTGEDGNVTTVTVPTFPPGECGQRPLAQDYIVGGVEAQPHSWPWMVSLELDYFGWDDWQHHCGGSLINNQWVVTAAHCYVKAGEDDVQYFRIVFGMHDRDDQSEPSRFTAAIETIIPHPLYDPEVDGSPNDIALVKLINPVEFSKEVSPICLPDYKEQEYLEEHCIITGWGLTKDTGDENVLNEANITVITNELCDYKWEVGSGRVGLIKENHICVGNGLPEGACNGDSGGPLNCLVGDAWQLAGATSFGAGGCLAEDAPDVYTRISYFLDWIAETVTQNF